MYRLLAVGADVEFFLRHKDTYEPTPAIGVVGGTKEQPRLLFPTENDKFSAVQEDNVMVEFNVVPSNTPHEFARNVRRVLDALIDEVQQKGYIVDIMPYMEFNPHLLQHPQAQIVGCNIDYNAWTWAPNPPVNPELLGNIRTAGGHVHISYMYTPHENRPNLDYDIEDFRDPDTEDQVQLVRMLDLTLGVPSVLLGYESVRRRFYGKAGAFRPKPYGVEYRTLSNFWIKNPVWTHWVFKQVQLAMLRLNREGPISPKDEELVQQCINENREDIATHLCVKYNLMSSLPHV